MCEYLLRNATNCKKKKYFKYNIVQFFFETKKNNLKFLYFTFFKGFDIIYLYILLLLTIVIYSSKFDKKFNI
uniref:Uncharacterized protein n=1 Tax=Strongyloides stercoralis TaxID=6248 RepID=A0A0K0E3H6_STRER